MSIRAVLYGPHPNEASGGHRVGRPESVHHARGIKNSEVRAPRTILREPTSFLDGRDKIADANITNGQIGEISSARAIHVGRANLVLPVTGGEDTRAEARVLDEIKGAKGGFTRVKGGGREKGVREEGRAVREKARGEGSIVRELEKPRGTEVESDADAQDVEERGAAFCCEIGFQATRTKTFHIPEIDWTRRRWQV